MFRGISAHAGMSPKFPVTRFLQQFPSDIKPCIAMLAGSFGWESELIKGFISKFGDKKNLVEVFLSNGCGRRASRKEYTNFEIQYSVSKFNELLIKGDSKLKKKINQWLARIQESVWKYCTAHTVKCLCIELEDNLSDAAAESFVHIVRKQDPSLKIIRNPCTGGKSLAGADFLERHGRVSGSKKQIVNLDGWSVDFGDGERFFQHVSKNTARNYMLQSSGKAYFTWSARQQGYPDLQDWSDKPPLLDRAFVVTDHAIAGNKFVLRK